MIAKDLKLYFIIQNSYLNAEDFSDTPVEKYINQYVLTTSDGIGVYYSVQIGFNDAEVSDSILSPHIKVILSLQQR